MKKSIFYACSIISLIGNPVLTGCNPAPNATDHAAEEQSSEQKEADRLLSRCITQAKAQGYRDGQCAYSFIKTCTETQSRSQMEAVLRADQFGMIGAMHCPNLPATYKAEFDKF